MKLRISIGAALILGAVFAPRSFAAPEVTTHHTGQFHGRPVHYAAALESTDVLNAKGQPGANIVSIAYWEEGLKDSVSRPVIFVFNGGPITPSLWLHIGLMGPKRVQVPTDLEPSPGAFRLVDNAYCLLDAADLVFFDPATTGLSRVLQGAAPESYFSVKADGQETAGFIYDWLVRHGRLESPVYILGESYGTIRAVEAAGQLAELSKPVLVDGVVLMGQAVNIIEYVQRRQNIMSYVVSLPTLAAIAWYHEKVDRRGMTLEDFVGEARRFAEAEYLPALFRGNRLEAQQRDRIAERLQALSGIPAAYYREHQLKISKQEFRRELLKDRSLLLGETDGRYTAPAGQGGREEDPAHKAVAPFQTLFSTYLKEDLHVDRAGDYWVDSPVKGLDAWDWGAATPFSDWPYGERVAQIFKRNPHFRVFLANGYFDLQTTLGAAELAAREATWPVDRTLLKVYEGGHMAYTIEDTARRLSEDLREFVDTRH
jgi:carboxypeptidase C (cathepsin A)